MHNNDILQDESVKKSWQLCNLKMYPMYSPNSLLFYFFILSSHETLHNKAETLEKLIVSAFSYFALSTPTYPTVTLISL